MGDRLNRIHQLLDSIVENPKLEMTNIALPRSEGEEILKIAKEKTGIDWHNTLYEELGEFALGWKVKETDDEDVMGAVKILPLKKVMQDWNLDDGALKDFFILDFFADETCVGFFKGLDYLYLYRMGGGTQFLSLDFNGYFEICLAAKGFLYWPIIVRGFIDNKIVPEAERFEKSMPKLFSGTSLATIRETFERVKINPTAK